MVKRDRSNIKVIHKYNERFWERPLVQADPTITYYDYSNYYLNTRYKTIIRYIQWLAFIIVIYTILIKREVWSKKLIKSKKLIEMYQIGYLFALPVATSAGGLFIYLNCFTHIHGRYLCFWIYKTKSTLLTE